ncbi:MAG: 6-phosphofructokinase [Phycisphaeraceae bacterium]|nr:MAG: 6-phosphofructokinase [Phycisphaeraceae bacterium]
MPQAPRRIGVLTGGGDCPGLNAVIRAVTKSAIFDHGIEVFGIADGFLGLIEDRVRHLSADNVSNILTLGGTILGSSNRADPQRFAIGYDADGSPQFKDVTDDCMKTLRKYEIDTLAVIGGDGTMSGARNFVERGVNCIGLPKTIDNDLEGTDITFGFLTAVQIATDALDRLHTTASSHGRVMVVELMGRNAGWITLHAGVASGADVLLIPEIPYDLGSVRDFIKDRVARGKRCSIVCVSEGARAKGGKQVVARLDPTSPDPVRLGGIGAQLAGEIERVTNIETRATVLGHVVRGGTPVSADRVLGTQFGHHAVRLIAEGKRNRLVVMKDNRLTDVDITVAANTQRLVPADHHLIAAAKAVGTCFGD